MAHVASGRPRFGWVNWECFVPKSVYHIHWSVSGLGCTQSASVSGDGGSLSGLSGTFLQRDEAKVQSMSQTAGLMASALTVIPLGHLHMRPFQEWAASLNLNSTRPHGMHPGFAPTDAVVSHKLLGTPGCVRGAQTVSALFERAACSGQKGQYHVSGIYQQTARAAFMSSAHAGAQTDNVEQLTPIVAESH